MSTRQFRATALTAATLLAFTAGACDGSDDAAPAQSRPSLAKVTCPPAVDDVLMSGYTCATLTTRGTSGRPPVHLLVTTIRPAGAASPDPLIVVGEDFATTLNYAGLAPAADRLQRTLVLLNPRGVAGSDPDLSCPEVDELGPVVPRGGTDAWADAVDRCAVRLADAGVDLSAFGQQQMADDVLDLVEALGADSWNLGSWGTSGRVALEVLRQDPAGLRSVFLDSPETPADDPIGDAPVRTAAALSSVLDLCAADPGCRALPHTTGDVDRIADALEADPLTVPIHSDDQHVRVVLDGDLLVRLVRHMLSNNGASSQYFTAGAVPAVLAAADARDTGELASVIEPLLASTSFCEGYLPTCSFYHRTTLGAFLGTACGVAGAASETSGVPESVRRTFDADPYRAACDHWPAPPASESESIVSDVPVLLLTGAFDPYVDPAPRSEWQEELAGLSRLTMVEMPGWGHNVLGSGDCAQAMRNGFVADPEQPVDQSCLAQVPTAPDFLTHLGN